MKSATVLLALTSGVFGVGQAASPPVPPANLVACARIADATQRLGCYDSQMAAMGVAVVAPPAPTSLTAAAPPAAPSPATPVPAPAIPAPAPAAPAPTDHAVAATVAPAPAVVPESPAAKFGEDDLKQAARPKSAKADSVLLSSITSIKEVRPKLFLIVLANRQVWLQEGTQITAFFKAGYDVRIEKGLLGDYRMSTAQTGEKNWVKVTRLQ